jgi:hypothetical protein
MPNPQERIAQVRRKVEAGMRNVLGPRRGGGGASHGFARAAVESAHLTERYFYEQEISRNPAHDRTADPAGQIEITVPYDGHDFFTRQACADVSAQDGTGVDEVLIGHLALANHHRTDLGEVLRLSGSYGAVPIRVPVGGQRGPDALDSDEQACVITYDYAPNPDLPKVIPIDVRVELIDPDTVDLGRLIQAVGFDHRKVEDIPNRITQQVSFRQCLWLSLSVTISLPTHPRKSDLRPVVSRVSLDWPTITSLQALHVEVDDAVNEQITYNPVTRSIEWSNVPMHQRDAQTYQSQEMVLWIEQPGELYRQDSLNGTVEVEVPGHLLSGVESRLYNGIGALARPDRQPKRTTYLTCALRLILDDAFARRIHTPYQHLHFDELIPDEGRIADIRTALINRGFQVETQEPPRDGRDRYLLRASRAEGPDEMVLWLLAEGQRFRTKRQNQVPGGQMYESEFDSGELKVFVFGMLPTGSRALTHEMNALQHALRERFDRLRSRR